MASDGCAGSWPAGGTMKEKKYNYFYKITNIVNNKFYYGIHSTNNLNDKYMGSGKALREAILKYGIDNFKKEIIKYFDTFQEACAYEKEIVNGELVKNPNCYNLVEGGYYLSDEIIAKKKLTFNNINHQQGSNNSQYGKCWINNGEDSIKISRELISEYLNCGWILGRIIKNKENISKNNKIKRFWIYNSAGETKHVLVDELDEYISSGWYRGRKCSEIQSEEIQKVQVRKRIRVRDCNDNIFIVDLDDPRYISGELIAYNKGHVACVDSSGIKVGLISINDPRYISGEYKPVARRSGMKGKVIVKDSSGVVYCVEKDDPRYLSGELVGVNKGKTWKWNKK